MNTRPKPTDQIIPSPRERLLSLDAFRGFVIAAMLFVNMTWNQEVFHPQFFHIDWNEPAQGATFTDLVFPWFLFIAGAAIPLSMRSGRGRSITAIRKAMAAARRGLILYLLGVLLTVASSAPDRPLGWTDLFSWNILQLIGVGYFFAVCIYLLPRWAQASLVVAILAAKLATMTMIHADFVRTAMQEAGFSPRVKGDPITGTGTFTHFDDIKRWFHLEHVKAAPHADGRSRVGVFLIGWFGMANQFLPCAAIAVIGGWSTEIITSGRHLPTRRAATLAGFGTALTTAAFLLQAGYDPRGGGWLGTLTVPFSKWLFSPCYCLLAAGTGAVLTAGFYFVVDARRLTTFAWLRVYGLNALALYIAAELSFKMIFARWQITHPNGHSGSIAGGFIAWVEHASIQLGAGPWWSQVWGGWAFVTVWMVGWWLFCRWLWNRKIMIRV